MRPEKRMATEQPHIAEVVKEEAGERTQEPPMFRVILHNDDYTTREFVVELLVYVFRKSRDTATELMWRVHRKGRGVAGVYDREVAETKVATATMLAREAEFPLQVTMEPEP
jgi:ATP-dependent Clp protease adaptor protein ClpS